MAKSVLGTGVQCIIAEADLELGVPRIAPGDAKDGPLAPASGVVSHVYFTSGSTGAAGFCFPRRRRRTTSVVPLPAAAAAANTGA